MKTGEHGRRTADEVAFDKAFGAAIRRRRQTLGMSQGELGAAVEQSFQQIQKYELGANSVKVCRLAAIARALQTSPAALVADAALDYGEPTDCDRNLTVIMRNYLAASPEVQRAVQAFLSGQAK